MPLSPNDSRNAYMQIADDLRGQIRQGTYGPGDKLPSTAELVDKYGVANMTVQFAMRTLREEGLVYGVRGKGTYVRTDIDEADLGPGDDEQGIDELRRQVADLRRRVVNLESEQVNAEES